MSHSPETAFIAEAGFHEIKRMQRIVVDGGVQAFIVRPSGSGNT